MAQRLGLDPEFARYALSGIEAAIEKLQRQAAELRSIVGASAAGVKAAVGGGGGRPTGTKGHRVSPGHPSSLVLDRPATVPGVEGGPESRPKRTMSVEARRRISEAQKARWAKQKDSASARPNQGSRKRSSGSRSGRKSKR